MKRQIRIPIVIFALAMLALLLAASVAILSDHSANTTPQRVNIPQGASFSALLDSLDAHGVISSSSFSSRGFVMLSRIRGLHSHVHPGSYLLPARMPVVTLVQKLYRAQQDPIRLTIGKFRLPADLDAYLSARLMHSGFLIPDSLFHIVRPDTYEVYWTITPSQFLLRMQSEYDRFWNRRSPHPSLSNRQVIILASIVDEETNANEEKPLIASVYLNRLRLGMPLQADPTVKYAVGDFSLRRILDVHLSVQSPYNTYLHTGLPPSPICLPSASSVDAVLNAPSTPYLYFCASPLLDGRHLFAATLAEHNRNAARFHAALNARGIH